MRPKIYQNHQQDYSKENGCSFCKNCKGPFDGSDAIVFFVPTILNYQEVKKIIGETPVRHLDGERVSNNASFIGAMAPVTSHVKCLSEDEKSFIGPLSEVEIWQQWW